MINMNEKVGGVMCKKINYAKQLLSALPRADLGFFPTPMYKLENISKMLDINLYVKRDDFTGKNLFGGNKTRKLEYLIGKALDDKCEYVFTYGATQSNHAMQTVWASVSNQLKPVLYLTAVVEPDKNDIKSNLLLDKVFDAEIYIINLQDNESFAEADIRSLKTGREHLKRLESDGHKCMNIPMGGANEIGSAGYIGGYIELYEQISELDVQLDYLYHATGSGGTMAGLAAGQKLIGTDTTIQSIVVLDIREDYLEKKAALANATLEYIQADLKVEPGDFNIRTEFYAPGYECPNAKATEAIKLLAKQEGLLLDPVYTGKAFAALLHDVRSGIISKGSNVAFLHTGGATALFAEKKIIGDIL